MTFKEVQERITYLIGMISVVDPFNFDVDPDPRNQFVK